MKFIYALALLLSFASLAQSRIDVKALDASRNCWYTEFEDTKMIQIADFGGFDPKSYRVHRDDLKESIATAIQERAAQKNFNITVKGKYEAYLFCSSSGHRLIINAMDSEPAFIYNTQLDQLEEGEFALNHDAKAGFNLGSSVHTIIVKRKQYITSARYIELLKAFFPHLVASARFIRNSASGSIRVLPTHYFKTSEVIKSIESHPVLKHYTEYLELSSNQVFSGESGLLLNGIF